MRVAYFHPGQLAAARAYNQALLPALSGEVEVECFVETAAQPAGAPESLPPTFAEDAFIERDLAAPYDLCLYQLGDHPAYRFVWETLRRRPGVIVFLDMGLHRLLRCRPDDPADRQAIAEEYGELGQALAEYGARAVQSPWDNVAMPLGGIAASRGQGAIVHTREAQDALRKRLPALPVAFVPRPLPTEALPTEDPLAIRQRLGLRPRGPIVATFGPLPLARMERLARAYGRLIQDHPEALLLIAADDAGAAALWEEVLRGYRLLGAAQVREVGASLAAVLEIIAISDIGLYLGLPAPGEMPETPLRLMAAARAVILPAGRGLGEFPADCCAYVDPGAPEEDEIWAYLHLLIEKPELRQRLGKNAQAHIAAHAPAAAAREIRRFLESVQAFQEQQGDVFLPAAIEGRPGEPAAVDGPVEEGPTEVAVEEIMERIYRRIGERYLVERPLLPTFAAYHPPPVAYSAEDHDLFQSLGQANLAWELPEPEKTTARPSAQQVGAYVLEIARKQTVLNASVVRTLNYLVQKLFDPAHEAELTALKYELAALHRQIEELEKRVGEPSPIGKQRRR